MYQSVCILYNVPAIYYFFSLSLHDALPIYINLLSPDKTTLQFLLNITTQFLFFNNIIVNPQKIKLITINTKNQNKKDRKSTRLNSSHLGISYAFFCLKKKKQYNM